MIIILVYDDRYRTQILSYTYSNIMCKVIVNIVDVNDFFLRYNIIIQNENRIHSAVEPQ